MPRSLQRSACRFGIGWEDAGRTGNRHGGLAESPYNVYPTSDGWIAIICVGEQHWKTCSTRWAAPSLAPIRASQA